MKRLFILWASLLILITSCQPTPEPIPDRISPFVINYWPLVVRARIMPRQGIAGGDMWGCQPNAEWERRWNYPPADIGCDAGTGAEYERAVVAHIERPDHGNSTWFTLEETARNLYGYTQLPYDVPVFWFNEPEHYGQGNQSPADAMDFLYHTWRLYLDMGGDPSIPWTMWYVGGVNVQQCGLDWLALAFDYWLDTYGGEPPRAGFPVHVYADIRPVDEPTCPEVDRRWQWAFDRATTPDNLFAHWQAQVETALSFLDELSPRHDEVWIGEMGCLMPPNQHNAGCSEWDFTTAYMAHILDYLNDTGGPGFQVQRYAWYTDDYPWAKLYQSTWDGSRLTPLGELYTGTAPIHYADIEYIP